MLQCFALAPTNFQLIGVAISVNNGGKHIGILFIDNGQLRLFHLAWHYKLMDQVFEEVRMQYRYCWIESPLPPTVQKMVLASVRSIRSANSFESIPYGIFREGLCFDKNGSYIEAKNGQGMTCASFVLEIFRDAGINLLEGSSWIIRDADIEWQASIRDQLIRAGVDLNHISDLENHIGRVVRFRPEEVAAGIERPESELPLSFQEAEADGINLLQQISACR